MLIIRLLIGLLVLAGLTVAPVVAGPLCHIKDGPSKSGAMVATSLARLKEARSIRDSGDMKASDRMMAERRAAILPEGTPIYVEERADLVYARIRIEGTLDSLWMHELYLDCPKGKAK